ncbi:hypothetical protein JHK87_041108 [Glycine soja]|nr:hypothetical protein JHK87_041108 [Glycine soja]
MMSISTFCCQCTFEGFGLVYPLSPVLSAKMWTPLPIPTSPNLSYEAQLRAKEEQVRDLLIHVGRFSREQLQLHGVIKPIVPFDIQFHYRNEMEFSFGPRRWLPKELLQDRRADDDVGNNENYALGLHAPGFFDKILNVDNCLLQSHPANKVLAAVQECWRDPQLGFSPYSVHSHKGFLKHLMLRTGRDVTTYQPEVMVNFVTSSYKPELLKFLVDKVSVFPEVVSVVNNVNTSVGEEEYTLYGKSSITETLRGCTFQISANSFFQTNTYQAEVLYKLIEDCAGVRGDGSEIVLDLFCGTGTIDPNRPGMHMKLIKFLLNLRAPRIVYVSCNPATCARDLDYLCHGVNSVDNWTCSAGLTELYRLAHGGWDYKLNTRCKSRLGLQGDR